VEKQCVSCEVETELLYVIYMNFMRQSFNDDKLILIGVLGMSSIKDDSI
jgi:hypothetical protein